jgi:hypothetical protein
MFEFVVVAVTQSEASSLAVATRRPEETSFWVWSRAEFVAWRLSRAAMLP